MGDVMTEDDVRRIIREEIAITDARIRAIVADEVALVGPPQKLNRIGPRFAMDVALPAIRVYDPREGDKPMSKFDCSNDVIDITNPAKAGAELARHHMKRDG